jgi:hypothetical protein
MTWTPVSAVATGAAASFIAAANAAVRLAEVTGAHPDTAIALAKIGSASFALIDHVRAIRHRPGP